MPAMYSVLGPLAVLFMAQAAHAQLAQGTANAEVTIMLSLETGESLEIPLTKSLKTAGKMVGSAGLDATSAAKWGTGSVIQWRSKTQFANVKGAVSHDPSNGKSRILVSARDKLGETGDDGKGDEEVTCCSTCGKATIPVGGTDYCISTTEAAAWTKWKSATISGTTWTVYIKSLGNVYYCITSMSTSCQCDDRAKSFGTQGNFYACDWERVVRMADEARVDGDMVSNADALTALGETQACRDSNGSPADCTPKDPGCGGGSGCGSDCGGAGPGGDSMCPASDGSDTTSCSSQTSQTCSPTAAPTAAPTAPAKGGGGR